MQKTVIPICLVAVLAAFVGACSGPFPDALPATLVQIDRIRGDEDLSAQQKRAALEDLGLSPEVVNALLTDTREANQFGGDLRSAHEKVTTNRFDELTPDEVQIYGDEASEVDTSVDFDLSDTEAQVIVAFFETNDISSKDDLIEFLEDPAKAASIPSEMPEGALSGLFVDFNPDLLLERLP